MRFLVMVKATAESESGALPTREALEEMGAFNQTLDMGALKPASRTARITFAAGKPTVIDGPFTETKELVAGFWLLQCKSKEEIVERLSRAPFGDGAIEIRRLYELEELGL